MLLTEKQVWEIMQSWKDAKEPDDLKAMLQTFVKRVTVGESNIRVKLKIEVASNEYSGDDLTIDIRRNDIRRIYFSKKDQTILED